MSFNILRSISSSEVETRSRTSSNASAESSSTSITPPPPSSAYNNAATTATLLTSTSVVDGFQRNKKLPLSPPQTFDFIEPESFPTTSDLTNELSHSDEGLSDVDDAGGMGEFKFKSLAGRSNRMSYPFPSRNKSQSSPSLLLSEPITEENESENDEEDGGRDRRGNFAGRMTPRRRTINVTPTCRLSPIHSRRSSYSSSDDDDPSHILMGKKILSHSASSPSSVPTGSNNTDNTTNSNNCENNSSNNSSSKTSSSDTMDDKSADSTHTVPSVENDIITDSPSHETPYFSNTTQNKFTKLLNNNNNSSNTKTTSTDNLNTKMLSLIMEDLQQISSKKKSPSVMLKNLLNNAYGRHLSDTNLTTYSMQLQMALAAEKMKTTKSSTTTLQHYQKQQRNKSNSDTNLVKKFCNKKQQQQQNGIGDLFNTKEMIFKYLKRTHRPGGGTKSVSLSATIQEEDPIVSQHQTFGALTNTTSEAAPVSRTFSDIQMIQPNDLDRSEASVTNSNIAKQQRQQSLLDSSSSLSSSFSSNKKLSDTSAKYELRDDNDTRQQQQQQQNIENTKGLKKQAGQIDETTQDAIESTSDKECNTSYKGSFPVSTITTNTSTAAIISTALNGAGGGVVSPAAAAVAANASVCCSLV